MSARWRKFGLFLVSLGALYVVFVGTVADFAQVLSLKYGTRLLILLLVGALGYKGWELGRELWNSYHALQTRLDEARDFVLRSAERSAIVLCCAQAQWLFRQHGQSIRVGRIQAEGIVVLDVSHVPLGPDDNLVGMHFSIIGFNKGEIAKGTVQLCDSTHACIELYEKTEPPRVGDLAIPIEPPNATDLECLLGDILFMISDSQRGRQ